MNQAPAPNSTADGILTRLPLDRLHESPFNPRRTFTAIEELAADIKAQGVIQPIVVRPIVPPLFDAGRDTEAHRREREEHEQKRLAETEANRRLLRAVHDAAGGRNRTTDELRLVLRHLIEEIDNGEDGPELQRLYGNTPLHQLMQLLPTMTADALGLLLLDVLLVRGVECSHWGSFGAPEPLVQMAELHGIDVDAVRAGPVQASAPGDEPSTPPSAGAGADMGAGGMAAAGAGTGNAATANAEEDQDQMDEAGFAGDEAGRGRIAWPEPRKATA